MACAPGPAVSTRPSAWGAAGSALDEAWAPPGAALAASVAANTSRTSFCTRDPIRPVTLGMAAGPGLQLHGEGDSNGDRRGLRREHRAPGDANQTGAEGARADGVGQRRHRPDPPVAADLEPQRDLGRAGGIPGVADEALANVALAPRKDGRE